MDDTTQSNLCNTSSNSTSGTSTPPCHSQRLDLSLLTIVVLSLMDCLCCVLGVIGNSVVMVAITRNKYFRSTPDLFIFSLSAADLLATAIYVPMLLFLTIFLKELQRDEVYRQMMDFVGHLALLASISSIVGVSADRLIIIQWPLRYPKLVTKRLAMTTIFIIWLISTCISITNTYVRRISLVIWTLCIALLLATVVLYSYLFKVAHTQRKRIIAVKYHDNVNSNFDGNSNRTERTAYKAFKERKAAKTFAIVLGVFFLTWIPFLVYTISASKSATWFFEGFLWVTTFSLFNSFLNPYIYCARSRRYRNMVLKLLGVRKQHHPAIRARRVSTENTIRTTENS